jgi:hypothetical protein
MPRRDETGRPEQGGASAAGDAQNIRLYCL